MKKYGTYACMAPISDLWTVWSIRCCTCTRTFLVRALCCAPDTPYTYRRRRRTCTCPEDKLKRKKKKHQQISQTSCVYYIIVNGRQYDRLVGETETESQNHACGSLNSCAVLFVNCSALYTCIVRGDVAFSPHNGRGNNRTGASIECGGRMIDGKHVGLACIGVILIETNCSWMRALHRVHTHTYVRTCVHAIVTPLRLRLIPPRTLPP